MSTLFNLSDQYKQVLEIIQENGEEQVLTDTLESINDSIESKADGYVAVTKTLEAENDAIDVEIKRLQERKKVNQNGIKRLKDTLLDAMEYTGKTKFKTELHSYSIRNNAPSLQITDDTKIPKQFYVEQEPKLDKRELLKFVKDNGELDGLELKRTKSLGVR